MRHSFGAFSPSRDPAAAVEPNPDYYKRRANRRGKDEAMELTYSRVGDYLIPNIILNEPPSELVRPLGLYGRMHKAYLQEHRPILYSQLVLSEKLYPLCREVNQAAATRLAAIPNREAAHEIILSELVYA